MKNIYMSTITNFEMYVAKSSSVLNDHNRRTQFFQSMAYTNILYLEEKVTEALPGSLLEKVQDLRNK